MAFLANAKLELPAPLPYSIRRSAPEVLDSAETLGILGILESAKGLCD